MDEELVVKTDAGAVRGKWVLGVEGEGNSAYASFEGIPFAEAPVGPLRFQAPEPKLPWEGVRDALGFGPTAQRGDPGVTLIPEPSIPGESTLNVNVYTPSPEQTASGGLPVLVWIHGGGYTAGSPASPWYVGRNFNRDGIVTVTISYRLGFDGFGFIEGAPGNRAVLDWLAALEWVQRNIDSFGGDPDRVTIAGQSAGAGAVLTLLGMEKAQRLFHSVYAMSAPIPDVEAETAQQVGRQMAEELGVEPNLDGFLSVSEGRMLTAQKKAAALDPAKMEAILNNGLLLGPTVDGDLIPRRTIDSIRMGIGADKPLVIGVTDDEFSMIAVEMEAKLKWVPKNLLLKQMGIPRSARSGYLAANKDLETESKARLAGRIITDRMFKVPLLRVLRARGEAPTWAYRFAWPSTTFGFAEHCIDVPFFFDCLDGPAVEPLTGPNPPQGLADLVHRAAVRFIESDDPGWPKWTPNQETVRVYENDTTDVPDGLASVRAIFTDAT